MGSNYEFGRSYCLLIINKMTKIKPNINTTPSEPFQKSNRHIVETETTLINLIYRYITTHAHFPELIQKSQ